jgi:hypothetical protein
MKRLRIAGAEIEDDEIPVVNSYEDLLEYVTKEDLKKIMTEVIDDDNNELIYDYDMFDNLEAEEAPSWKEWFEEAWNIKGEIILGIFLNGMEKYADAYVDINCNMESLMEEIIENDASLVKLYNGDIEMAYGEYEHDNKYVENDGVENASELADNDDKVGDVIELDGSFDIDRPDRDAPFIYVDGDIIIGCGSGTGSSHTDLVNDYFDTDKNQNIRTRNLKQIDEADPNLPFASGHIVDNMAFIDQANNCTKEQVMEALKSEEDFDKIYDYDYSGYKVKRLAKLKIKRMD